MAEEFTSDLGVMPYNTMAEQSVLGAILLESSMLDEVLDFIKSPDYFY
ncbi:MAG: replicative DNA helicase, partial [Ruminococcus sp.]|nr:replicative DNA helicase [Ruminococcus sp.]